MGDGGRLKGCPLSKEQIGVLRKFRNAFTSKTQGVVNLKAGFGKTTLSVLFEKILRLEGLRIILHISPAIVAQAEWIPKVDSGKMLEWAALKEAIVTEPDNARSSVKQFWTTPSHFIREILDEM